MTTPKEALEQIAARSIAQNDDDAKELRRQLYHIASLAKSALAYLQGEDAVERVARIVDPEAFDDDRLTWENRRVRALTKARAILATGLVPDEAAIRADERERCAKVADERAEKLRVKAKQQTKPNGNSYFYQAIEARVIAAAIRSNRREA